VKTAVSVPEDLYLLAEAIAKRLRVSRSRLYATALSEYLARVQSENVTSQLNKIYFEEPAKLDDVLHRAQLQSMKRNVW
jgi:metal-responsive CopG/Arc/MetJ family transcriptional regulator